MMGAKAPLTALLLTAVALAGCTGGDSLGISVTEPDDPVTGTYVFKATGSADRFEWDFGDGSAKEEGRTVEHVFGFTDGKVTVRLTAYSGDTAEAVTRQLVMGTGENALPAIAMEGTSNWLVPGEPIRLSGLPSTDSDGDPILFKWTCVRDGNLLPAEDHVHPDSGGVPFGFQGRAAITAIDAAPDRTVTGDLCETLGEFGDKGFTSTDAVLEGSFSQPGGYKIIMQARDPKSSAEYHFVAVFVSESRPEPMKVENFAGTLVVGTGGVAQDVVGNELNVTIDRGFHEFDIEIPNKSGALYFNVTGPQGLPVPETVSYHIERGGSIIYPARSDAVWEFGANRFVQGSPYTLVVTGNAPSLLAEYTVDLVLENDLDPLNLFEYPGQI